MKQSLSTALTLTISAFLLIEGIWGMFSPVVFGIFPFNRTHAVVHILLGLGGMIAWRTGWVRSYFGFLGSLLIMGAVLWFLPSTRGLSTDLLNVNVTMAGFNFVLGLVVLVIAFTQPSRRRFGVPGSSTNPPMKVARKTPRKAA